MKKLFIPCIVLGFLLLWSSCAPRISETYYAPRLLAGQKIAIIPYEIYTSGRVTERLSEAEMIELDSIEGKTFQSSMYHQLMEHIYRAPYDPDIKVQHYQETNRLLDKAQLSLLNINSYSNEELIEILGVDVIIKTEVRKHIYLTDMEAFGISAAHTLMFIFSDFWYWDFPHNKTGDVFIAATIFQKDEQGAIWSVSRECSTNWRKGYYEAINSINYHIAKRLPF